MATHDNITRRSLVAALGAAIPATVVAAAPALAGSNADAELIAVGKQLDGLYEKQRALMPEYEAANKAWGDAIRDRSAELTAVMGSSEATYKELWKPFAAAHAGTTRSGTLQMT